LTSRRAPCGSAMPYNASKRLRPTSMVREIAAQTRSKASSPVSTCGTQNQTKPPNYRHTQAYAECSRGATRLGSLKSDCLQVLRGGCRFSRARVNELRSTIWSSSLVSIIHLMHPPVTHRFQALLRRVGIGHHRFHDLRHTAATLLAVQGVHPRAIQAALGWENLSMLDRYAHFVEEQRQAVASAMDSILTPVAVKVAVYRKDAKPS
jgi:hypothetical protein